jgi:hypothetical protein
VGIAGLYKDYFFFRTFIHGFNMEFLNFGEAELYSDTYISVSFLVISSSGTIIAFTQLVNVSRTVT